MSLPFFGMSERASHCLQSIDDLSDQTRIRTNNLVLNPVPSRMILNPIGVNRISFACSLDREDKERPFVNFTFSSAQHTPEGVEAELLTPHPRRIEPVRFRRQA